MAFLDDDFQSYPIGTGLPFGAWTGNGSVQIVAGGPDGTDRNLQVGLGVAEYVRGYLSSFSQFTALRLVGPLPFSGSSFSFANGPNGTGHTFTLMRIKIETDSTLSCYCDINGQLLGNSGDFTVPFNTWNFIQTNVVFSDVLNVSVGVLCINIVAHIAVNGVEVLSFNVLTDVPVGQLANGTSEVNQFELTGGNFDAYTLDTVQPIVTYPHPGTPSAIVNQGAIEIELLPDSADVHVNQGVIELNQLPDSANVLIHQGVIELLIGLGLCYISES